MLNPTYHALASKCQKLRRIIGQNQIPNKPVLQTTFIKQCYRLTYQAFLNYSTSMQTELDELESKLAQLLQLSQRLRAENHQLRQELAIALSHERQYSDKMESARKRLENVLSQLPENTA